jgi:hypothetical protein
MKSLRANQGGQASWAVEGPRVHSFVRVAFISTLVLLLLVACSGGDQSVVPGALRAQYCAHLSKWRTVSTFEFGRTAQETAQELQGINQLFDEDSRQVSAAGSHSTGAAIEALASRVASYRTALLEGSEAVAQQALQEVELAIPRVSITCPTASS